MLVNLSKRESNIRVLVGTLAFTVGSHAFEFMLIPMGIVMLYTGLVSKCPITHLFVKPNRDAIENRYLNFLPKFNPQPVFVFQANNSLAFSNKKADQVLPHIKKFQDIVNQDAQLVIDQESVGTKILTLENGTIYSLIFRGAKNIDGVFVYATEITEIVELNLEIIETQKEVVYTMGEIGETRSKETGDHVRRVAEYSEILALLCGLEKEEAELIKLASPMHDIGKVGIPDAILKKPGKLDKAEFEIMKTHAEIGYDLLKHSERPILKTAAIIAGQHHEKWNGSGYPRKLAGEDIHIYGRITAIADVFDALGSARIYKDAWPLEKILSLFAEQRGIHFDPNLVDLMIENLDQFLEIRKKYPN